MVRRSDPGEIARGDGSNPQRALYYLFIAFWSNRNHPDEIGPFFWCPMVNTQAFRSVRGDERAVHDPMEPPFDHW